MSPARGLLLLGASGQVGGEVRRLLAQHFDVQAPPSSAVDLRRPDDLRGLVRSVRPDVIINAAAYTAVDQAESEPGIAQAVNAAAPGVLAEEAARLGALFVHYSTDYVFDGTARSPYAEDAPTGPLSVYGRTKLEGERRVALAGGRSVILRTSWVYSPGGRNFLLTMRRLFSEREEVRVVSDQHGAPTAAHAVADATRRVVLDAPAADRCGLFHVSATGATTWHGFAEAILAKMGGEARCTRVTAIPSSAYPTAARRPAYSVLDGTRFARAFAWRPTSWQQQLEETWVRLEGRSGVPPSGEPTQ